MKRILFASVLFLGFGCGKNATMDGDRAGVVETSLDYDGIDFGEGDVFNLTAGETTTPLDATFTSANKPPVKKEAKLVDGKLMIMGLTEADRGKISLVETTNGCSLTISMELADVVKYTDARKKVGLKALFSDLSITKNGNFCKLDQSNLHFAMDGFILPPVASDTVTASDSVDKKGGAKKGTKPAQVKPIDGIDQVVRVVVEIAENAKKPASYRLKCTNLYTRKDKDVAQRPKSFTGTWLTCLAPINFGNLDAKKQYAITLHAYTHNEGEKMKGVEFVGTYEYKGADGKMTKYLTEAQLEGMQKGMIAVTMNAASVPTSGGKPAQTPPSKGTETGKDKK